MYSTHHTTIIVGAGLAGLNLARMLEEHGHDYLLLEAKEQTGGRVLTQDGYDLGPSWFWAGQPRVISLAQQYGLSIFEQFKTGDLIYDDGNLVRRLPEQAQPASYRIDGGIASLSKHLVKQVPKHKVRLNSIVSRIEQNDSKVLVTLRQSNERLTITCDQVVLALPPRLIESSIQFNPSPDYGVLETIQAIPTWMASHAKLVVTFEKPFWKLDGLSGDAFSQQGPLGEIHDASTTESPALFGFFSWDAKRRRELDQQQLEALVTEQLGKLFGEWALHPTSVRFKDWSSDAFTSTELDQAALNYHPRYGLNDVTFWDNRVVLAGTETSLEYGGFIEGALASAERAYGQLNL